MSSSTLHILERARLLGAALAAASAMLLALAGTASADSGSFTGCWPKDTNRVTTRCVTYGYIKIIKVANPDDTTKFRFKADSSSTVVFTSEGSGYSSPIKVPTGTHSLTEVIPAGWELKSATCDKGSATLSGNKLSNIKVYEGLKTTCTFTNKKLPVPAKLKVIKKVINDNSGTLTAGDFSLWVKSGAAHVTGSPAAGSSTGTEYSLPAGSYTVGEDARTGYTSSISGDCAENGSVTLAEGQSKTCTITNDDVINPSISIVKTADPTLIYRGEKTTYTIVATNDGDDPLRNVVIGDDTCGPLEYVGGDDGEAGVMEVGESWTYTCTTNLSQNTLNTVIVEADDSDGQPVTAMAVAYVEVMDRPPTGPTTDPGPTVAPQAVVSVKLARYNRCISRRFTIRPAISGGTPKVTVLKIDGKKRATSRSANPKFIVNTGKYKARRTHRVVVTTTFTNGRKATARSSFTRCSAAGAANPRFTG